MDTSFYTLVVFIYFICLHIIILALGISAGGAMVAAFLVDQHVGAFRALAGHILDQAVVFQLSGRYAFAV